MTFVPDEWSQFSQYIPSDEIDIEITIPSDRSNSMDRHKSSLYVLPLAGACRNLNSIRNWVVAALVLLLGGMPSNSVAGPDDPDIVLSMEAEVLPDFPVGATKVGDLSFGDLDPSGLTFEFVSGEGDTHNGFFELQGNQLFVVEPFNNYDDPELSVRIQCSYNNETTEEMFTIPTEARDFVVDIPDANLEAELARRSGLPVGWITRNSIAKRLVMDLEDVHDWSGLEHARDIETIEVSETDYLDYEMLGQFGSLERLTLNNVDIDDLAWLPIIENLQYLTVSNVTLQDWSFPDGLNEGMTVQLTNCNLESISILSDVVAIEDLQISNCPWMDLSGLDLFTHLNSLDLMSMNLGQLPDLSGLDNLEHINFFGNQIQEIDIEKLPAGLRNFEIKRNVITDVEPLLGLYNLTMIDLSENYIDLANEYSQSAAVLQLRSRGATVYTDNQFPEMDIRVEITFTAMANQDGFGEVQLVVTGVTGPVKSFLWSWEGGQAEGVNPAVSFPEGVTGITLTATDFQDQERVLNSVVNVLPWIRMPGEGPGAAEWLQTELADLPEALRYPDADPDGDGLSNLLEYVFVRDPLSHDSGGIINLQRRSIINKLAFRYRNDDPNLHLNVSRSADLINWESTGIRISTEDYRWIIDDRLYKISTTYQEDGTWEINLTAPRAADVEQYFRLDLVQDAASGSWLAD